MPTCEICHQFYVRQQTFSNLFSFSKSCHICETNQHKHLHLDVIPVQYNEIYCYSFQSEEHPIFTIKYFQKTLKESQLWFFEKSWLRSPEILPLLSALTKPLKLYHSEDYVPILQEAIERYDIF